MSPKSSWQKGAAQEKIVKEFLEVGGYDGEKYSCVISQHSKFYRQDFWGHDIICVNKNRWLLCQVKYRSNRLPQRLKKVVEAMLATPMPKGTKRLLARIDGRTNTRVIEEIGGQMTDKKIGEKPTQPTLRRSK